MRRIMKKHSIYFVLSVYAIALACLFVGAFVATSLKKDDLSTDTKVVEKAKNGKKDNQQKVVATSHKNKVDYTEKRLKRKKEYFANVVTQQNRSQSGGVIAVAEQNDDVEENAVVPHRVETTQENSQPQENVQTVQPQEEKEVEKPNEVIPEAKSVDTPSVDEVEKPNTETPPVEKQEETNH